MTAADPVRSDIEHMLNHGTDLSITRRKLVTIQIQQRKVDVIDAMGVGRHHIGDDLRAVVHQQVKEVMAFMFIRANNPVVNAHMMGIEAD